MDAYLPAGIWYDFYTKTAISSSGQYVNWTAPLDTIPLFVRGGSILPQQAANQTTTDSRKNKIELLASLDENKAAYGELYWDDGDSLCMTNRLSPFHFNFMNTLGLFQYHSKKNGFLKLHFLWRKMYCVQQMNF